MNKLAKLNKKKLSLKNTQQKFLPLLNFNNVKIGNFYKLQNEATKQAQKELREQKKRKKKKLLNVLAFALNIAILAILLITQISVGDANEITSPTIHWKYLGILVAIVFAQVLLGSLKYFILIKKATHQIRPFLSYKVAALGRYYDNITPMSTGGQPFQMLYMNKRGVRGDVATGIPLMSYIIFQVVFVLSCSGVLICNSVLYGGTADPVTTTVAWIIVAVNLIIFSTIILLSVSKKFGPRLVIWGLKLLSKIHIVKSYQKSFRKVMRFVVNYQKTFKTLIKSPLVLISLFVIISVDMFLGNAIPYFVCLTFVDSSVLVAKNITFLKVFIQSTILGLTSGIIPTPGASGGAEGLFLVIFGSVFGKNSFWPVLTWRISTYYFYLLQGLLVLAYDFVIGNKKCEKLKKEGASIYNQCTDAKPTFRETLAQNRQSIDDVQTQEQDKLAMQTFARQSTMPDTEENDLIKNSNLVSSEEMIKKVYPAEQLLMEMQIKDMKKRKTMPAGRVFKRAKIKKYRKSK